MEANCSISIRGMTYAGRTTPTLQTGTAYTSQTFVRVHWGWVSMLGAQLVLTSAFLLAIMWESWRARIQILKSSTLATMCAMDSTGRDAVGGIVNGSDMEKRAKELGVRLGRAPVGDALWLYPTAKIG